MDDFESARRLIREFTGDKYVSGNGVLDKAGPLAAGVARTAALIYTEYPGVERYVEQLRQSFLSAGFKDFRPIAGAAPNAPREDLLRIAEELKRSGADIVVSFGGGSTIDAAKGAEVLRTIGGGIDGYFGTNLVSAALENTGKRLRPHMAIQSAAGTGAHLTKYSNITDVRSGQKKLIVDEALIPQFPIFDFTVTHTAPASLTTDGALDGVSHILEVLFGAVGKPYYGTMVEVARPALRLILSYLPVVLKDPKDSRAREALCLATDLGGYAIMLGGTNGAHLTSFSLVDILSHGRACAIMNPYYTVFFAPAIGEPLRFVAELYRESGFLQGNPAQMSAKTLGLAVAEAMFAFAQDIGFPTKLSEIKGFSEAHIAKALAAAKDPQLKMKLENMPVPLTASMVDEYMKPILEAAQTGDLSSIRNVPL